MIGVWERNVWLWSYPALYVELRPISLRNRVSILVRIPPHALLLPFPSMIFFSFTLSNFFPILVWSSSNNVFSCIYLKIQTIPINLGY